MTARKLSISVPPEVEATIKAAAAGEGKPVSTWLAEAATEKARAAALHAAGRAAARELVADYETEHGPPPPRHKHTDPSLCTLFVLLLLIAGRVPMWELCIDPHTASGYLITSMPEPPSRRGLD